MGRILGDYPDVAQAVMDLVKEWFPELEDRAPGDWRVGRVWPDSVQDILAAGESACRVTDIGGNDDGLTDRPLIDIHVLSPTFTDARRLCVGIQSRLLGYPWRTGSTVIDKVRTAMRPHEVPWDDDNTYSYYSSFTVSARRG